MSHAKCPICGRYVPISTLSGEGPEQDVEVVTFKGKGRGKGFEIVDRTVVDDADEISQEFKKRSMNYMKKHQNSGNLKMGELSSELNVPALVPFAVNISSTSSSTGAKTGKSVSELDDIVFELEEEVRIRKLIKKMEPYAKFELLPNENSEPSFNLVKILDSKKINDLFMDMKQADRRKIYSLFKTENLLYKSFFENLIMSPEYFTGAELVLKYPRSEWSKVLGKERYFLNNP